MMLSGEYSETLVIQEMMMEPDSAIVDFNGSPSSTSAVAERYGVRIAPTVLLLSPGGRPLASPIIGINTSEMYGHYLDEAIAGAASAGPADSNRELE